MRISPRTSIHMLLSLITFSYMYGMNIERDVNDIIPKEILSSAQAKAFIPQITQANNAKINNDIQIFTKLFNEYLKNQNDLPLKRAFGSFNDIAQDHKLAPNQEHNYKTILANIVLEKASKEDAKRRNNLLLTSGALVLATIATVFLRSYTDQSASCKEKILQEQLAQGTFDVDAVAARDRFDIYSSFMCDTIPGFALKMLSDATAGLQSAGSLVALLKAKEENPRTKKIRSYLLSLSTPKQS